MRMLLHFEFPVETFNKAVRDGSAGDKIRRILEEIRPEVAYFSEKQGKRGGTFVVQLDKPSDVPRLAEPLFLAFDAAVEFRVCMTPEELGAAGLDAIGKSWR